MYAYAYNRIITAVHVPRQNEKDQMRPLPIKKLQLEAYTTRKCTHAYTFIRPRIRSQKEPGLRVTHRSLGHS